MDFGFLLISLKSFANVDLITLREFALNSKNKEYDHVVLEAKLQVNYNREEFLPLLKKKIKSKVSIFLAYDRLITNDDVDYFENFLDISSYLVPNLLKNYDLYNLSVSIKDKLIQTHYGLGFLEIPYDFKKKFFIQEEKSTYKYNSSIFYSGSKHINKQSRTKIIDYLLKDEIIKDKLINYYEFKDAHKYKLTTERYIKCTQTTRINLVLSGIANNITYRLYEVLFLRSFFLIEKNFINYKISESFQNYSDFVFEDINDLDKKIKFFLNNYKEAELIREKQTQSFENFYNPIKHGIVLKKIFLL